MSEPERWKTERRCPNCSTPEKPIYVWGQKWGNDEEGNPLVKLDCWEGKCGYSETTTWSGH